MIQPNSKCIPLRVLAVAAALLMTYAFAAPAQQAPSPGTTGKPVSGDEAKTEQVTEPGAFGAGVACPYCNLAGRDLSGQDLSDVNLLGADLSGANLSGATLKGAVLSGANLSGANLAKADLSPSARGASRMARANLHKADLSGANLSHSDLQYANIACALFDATGLEQTRIGRGLTVADSTAGCKATFRNLSMNCDLREYFERMDVAGAQTAHCQTPALGAETAYACGDADLSGLASRVYVAASGADSTSCGSSPANACATIAKGIAQCAGSNCGVLVGYGQYRLTATLALKNGVSVYGGCLPATQADPAYFSVIDAPSGGKPGVSATAITTPTLFYGFQMSATQAPNGAGATSTAMTVSSSPALQLDNVQLVANQGGIGTAGVQGGNGQAGPGGSGQNGGSNGPCSGGWGGDGNQGSTIHIHYHGFLNAEYNCEYTYYNNGSGFAGGTGQTGIYAAGGGKGGNHCTTCPSCPNGGTGGTGVKGANGACGGAGTPSTDTIGHFGGSSWGGSQSGTGATGKTAGGGGGGGSGGCCGGDCFGAVTHNGNRGGGGGAGGCGAHGGSGGHQGGASFAMILIGSSVKADGITLYGGTGGTGGTGGKGGSGGSGGNGAGGGSGGGGKGGTGGKGGIGGSGGGGAGGNGGPAIGVALVSGSNLTGQDIQYYPGRGGQGGQGGSGGSTSSCTGTGGQGGKSGTVANTHAY